MTLSIGLKSIGTRLAVIATSITIIGISGPSLAQENAPGANVDPTIFKLFLESRIQKPAEQASAMERTGVMNELRDIYLVTNLPRAIALGEEGEVKAQIEFQRRATLFNAFAVDFLGNNPATDEEIVKKYEEQNTLSPAKEFKARHILVESQSAALGIIKELQEGAEFGELAMAKSTGPSGPNGGNLEWFGAQAMVKPFSDAIALLDDGAFTSAPVQTQFGWHVILRENSRDAAPPPLDSVRDVIKNQIEQQKFQDFIKSLH